MKLKIFVNIETNKMQFQAVSDIHEEKYTLDWKINNFSAFIKNKDLQHLVSPIFFSVGKSQCDWQLYLHKTKSIIKTDNTKEEFKLHLRLLSSSKVKTITTSQIQFWLSGVKSSQVHNLTLSIGQGPILTFTISTNNLFLMEKMAISCIITYSVNVISSIAQPSKIVENISNTLSADFKSAFEHKDFSDMKLITQGKEFKVHKFILSARSPVFSAMFQHDMKEQQINKVEMNDVAPDVLNEMLHFIYTDEVNNIKSMTADLLVLAEKYDIKGLKVKCELALQETLTIHNVFETLNLAYLHNAENLKNYTLNFTKKFKKNIIETSEFKALERSEPSMVSEIFRFVVSN